MWNKVIYCYLFIKNVKDAKAPGKLSTIILKKFFTLSTIVQNIHIELTFFGKIKLIFYVKFVLQFRILLI